MNVMEKLSSMTIISKYADLKREKFDNNPLMNDGIKNAIITYIDNTENLFKKNFITLDEAIMRIAMAADNVLKEAQP